MVERQDWGEKYKRARADYVNLERRARRQQEDLVKYTNEVLLKKLLPILTDLEKAVESHKKDGGLNLILKNFWEVLKLAGVEEIKVAVGDKFDPKMMEGVITESIKDSEGTEAKVGEVLRKGYQLRDKVLRPVEVKVGGSDAKNNWN